MDFIDRIFIINLKHRTDRWKDIMEELSTADVPMEKVERFDAIQKSPGWLGCTMSHFGCLSLAKDRGYRAVIILEDDFSIFEPCRFAENLGKIRDAGFAWDMMFLTGTVFDASPHNDHFNRIGLLFSCSAYVIQKSYMDTLLANYQEAIDLPDKLDENWKVLQRRDRWFVFKNRVGCQRSGYSDIEERYVNYGC